MAINEKLFGVLIWTAAAVIVAPIVVVGTNYMGEPATGVRVLGWCLGAVCLLSLIPVWISYARKK